MKRHLGKKAMAVVTAALLMMSAVPANVMAEETTEATAQTEVTQETVQAAAETTSATQETEETTAETAVTQQEQELSTVSTTAESDFTIDNNGIITRYTGSGGDVIIPETIGGIKVTKIGGWSFAQSAITSITIPNGVTTIGKWAFMDCKLLKSITIPASVTNLTGREAEYDELNGVFDFENVFNGCTLLSEINIDVKNNIYCSIDGIIYSKDKTKLVACPPGKQGSINIPTGVTIIGKSAFSGCKYITSIRLPNSVRTIGGDAFYECTSLSNINILNGVTTIGGLAFAECKKLTSITFPDSVTSIGYGVVNGCTKLTDVTFPKTLKEFPGVGGCSSLTSVTIPSGVTELWDTAFGGCNALKTVIFEGNAPTKFKFDGSEGARASFVDFSIFINTNVTVYYRPGATGFTTPIWMDVPCYPLEGESPDNQPSDDTPITTPSGDILDFGELSQEEQDKVENKVLAVLNVENLGANEAMHFYDITLTNKETGEIYTKDNFPKEGVTVTIPYPVGMNKNSHSFRLFHFANGADGEGTEVEITLTDEGIQFHVYSLSPFALVSTEAEANGGTVGGTTGGTTNGTDGTAAADTDTVTSPKTGDGNAVILLIASMALAGIAGAVVIKKKAKKI